MTTELFIEISTQMIKYSAIKSQQHMENRGIYIYIYYKRWRTLSRTLARISMLMHLGKLRQ